MVEKRRKPRQDRTHLLYVITNTVTGQQYIGLTVKTGPVRKTLHRRIQKHVQRALAEDKGWELSQNIREYGCGAFTYGLLDTVRGRKPAHSLERQYIATYNPELNTH